MFLSKIPSVAGFDFSVRLEIRFDVLVEVSVVVFSSELCVVFFGETGSDDLVFVIISEDSSSSPWGT